jgi:hypothetical protein
LLTGFAFKHWSFMPVSVLGMHKLWFPHPPGVHRSRSLNHWLQLNGRNSIIYVPRGVNGNVDASSSPGTGERRQVREVFLRQMLSQILKGSISARQEETQKGQPEGTGHGERTGRTRLHVLSEVNGKQNYWQPIVYMSKTGWRARSIH